MSEQIKHECGIALIRLLKPLEYYIAKYGTALYGMKKLHLLMQKQHNRGQDGAGLATVKFDLEPGHKYIHREKSELPSALEEFLKHFVKSSTIWKRVNLHICLMSGG